MGETRDDGGPAFPIAYQHTDPLNREVRSQEWQGMTLLDYFAGQAPIGILGSRHGFLIDTGTSSAAPWAYDVAEAMLAERARRALLLHPPAETEQKHG